MNGLMHKMVCESVLASLNILQGAIKCEDSDRLMKICFENDFCLFSYRMSKHMLLTMIKFWNRDDYTIVYTQEMDTVCIL